MEINNFKKTHTNLLNNGTMNRIEDGYKIMLLTDYKLLIGDAFKLEEYCEDASFEMHNMLEREIDNVVDRLIFENTYEIFPN